MQRHVIQFECDLMIQTELIRTNNHNDSHAPHMFPAIAVCCGPCRKPKQHRAEGNCSFSHAMLTCTWYLCISHDASKCRPTAHGTKISCFLHQAFRLSSEVTAFLSVAVRSTYSTSYSICIVTGQISGAGQHGRCHCCIGHQIICLIVFDMCGFCLPCVP